MVRPAETTMKRGVVIFAYNSGEIDYQALAAWSAARIRRHLDLPTTLITDTVPVDAAGFEHVIITTAEAGGTRHFFDIGHTVTWYNGNRMKVCNLSPYDETLVLDADYVVCSSQLNLLFEMPHEFLAPITAYDITNTRTFDDLNWFGTNRMPMAWATVMRFNRSLLSNSIFDMMLMIRNNWQHYRNLYGISQATYRNDYALSIALNTLHGHQGRWPSVPWKLASVVPDHLLEYIDPDTFKVSYKTSNSMSKHVTISGQDFHAMGKKHLGDIVASTS
jgi:hypothetical protein